jgi:hypothetical protein
MPAESAVWRAVSILALAGLLWWRYGDQVSARWRGKNLRHRLTLLGNRVPLPALLRRRVHKGK